MARKKAQDDDVSLDSLLDTMTNVVAILVILLIVTQLGVSDAVKRIAQQNPVDPELVAKTAKTVKRDKNRLQTLKALAVATPESPEDLENQLKNVNTNIEAAKKQLADLEKKNKTILLLAQAQETQKSKQADLEKLNKEIQVKLEEIQQVEAQLEKIPVRTGAPTEVVNLPNPRSAPPGSKPFLVLIKNQRVFPLDLETFRKQAEVKAEQIITRAKLNRDPKSGIDPSKFLSLFNKQKLRNAFFEVTMKANGPTPVLVFQPIERKGFEQKLLTNRSGPFWKSLAATDNTKFYMSFVVWSESFEVYLTARKVCSELGFAAGWSPQSTTSPLERNLGGNLRFGPPPPPPKTDPNKPKVNPPPDRKPVPIDTVD